MVNSGISLPSVYSRNKIPFNRDHIPSKVMTADWPYLDPLKHKLVPKMNCEVGMLIGYDCPRALVPREVITSKDSSDGPFGFKDRFRLGHRRSCWSFNWPQY